MIIRYRNKAIKLLCISFSLLVLLILLVSMQVFGLPGVLIAVGSIILCTFSFVFYVQGSLALARARGHDSSALAAIIIVAGLCLPGLFFVMPLIILGFEDRNKVRRAS